VDEKRKITLYFNWDSFMPDYRQFKPASPIIYSESIMIAIDVPLVEEYIFNFDELNKPETQTVNISPILTPKGMRYCIDQFADVMMDEDKSSAKDFVSVDIDFEEDEKNAIVKDSVEDWTPQFEEGDTEKFDDSDDWFKEE
jgi:hypothetical protein